MCYVRNDGNIVIEIKQLIFKRAGKPSESVLGRLLLVRLAAHVSNGLKSRIRPVVGRI